MASYVQVSNLDFQQIKASLKEYLRSQTDFTSYDFEGSTLNVLLDVLAYNTYYTAFNANMAVNELFLDSATIRDNVVALAKQLGYKPKSRTAPEAKISFTVTYPQTAPKTAVLKKGSGFTTSYEDTLYSYVAVEDQTAPVENGTAYFDNISVYEGTLINSTFVVNENSPQRFILQNPNIDIDSIRVKVYNSQQASAFSYYEYADNILNVNPDSKAFFLEEIEDERYEMFFGDDVIGRKVKNNELIEISYLSTNGPDTNGAKAFTFAGVLLDIYGGGGYTNTTQINSVQSSFGGSEIEGISKIKFNAPKFFATQDRAVTAQDYAAIIRNLYPAVSDIITYGGEEDLPPEYGKVKIVIKPELSATLSSSTKRDLEAKLKKYMVASVTPEIIDPSILYVEVVTNIFYDSTKTTQRPEQIVSKVVSGLDQYLAQSDTEKFNGKFRFSKFVSTIDNADLSINSNSTAVTLRKDFYPQINSTSFYEICYQNVFDKECNGSTVQSTGFKVSEFPAYTVYFEDRDGVIVLYRLDNLTGEKITLNDSLGTVDYEEGEIKLYNLTIVEGTLSDNRVSIRVQPKNFDVVALREVYLDVDLTTSKFTAYPE
jgi:hypothetical protein